MEHQVFVPVPADNLRAVLRDPARVARCVPGLQRDAAAPADGPAPGPLTGRFRIRVGNSTVTYRGELRPAERDPDTFELTGEGIEARGSGTVTLTLILRLRPVDGGTQLDLTARGHAQGRAAAFDPDALAAAVRRTLDRAAEQLAALAAADLTATDAAGPDADPGTADASGSAGVVGAAGSAGAAGAAGAGRSDADGSEVAGPGADSGGRPAVAGPRVSADGPAAPAKRGARGGTGNDPAGGRPDAEVEADPAGAELPQDDPAYADSGADAPVDSDAPPEVGTEVGGEAGTEAGTEAAAGAEQVPGQGDSDGVQSPSLFGTEVPPSALDPALDPVLDPILDPGPDPFLQEEFTEAGRPPAEAAHARRTMIGRSAEEVDHAPPRGRYAPVPGPDTAGGAGPLRWAAPAAALALASAVVAARVLRRRR
ncbi:SRPBCC family protein [Streptomyces sp. NPDC097619]|uniref:SRPBCC family protein n=1 Tax=Streptomyces sp. NPDC097619 TaxID=3157228 RepID=UPI00332663FF